MSKILVLSEVSSNGPKRSTQELVCAAKKSGHEVLVLALGSNSSKAQALEKFGAAEVLYCADATYDQYNSDLWTHALCETIQTVKPLAVLASNSSLGKDLLPRVAARLQFGIATDCTELSIEGEKITVKKPVYSGKAFATVGFENSATKLVTMRANQLPVVENPTTAKMTTTTFSAANLMTKIKEIVQGTSQKLDLTEANIIVAGGRGLKEAGNFQLLNSLADVLGATVGASRAVVDAGWVSHEMQVGQTGKTVAPSLYIAVGISGAIQHLAGMSSSKVIVAINNDPNAPIFQKATYGIVGDLFEVVPMLTEEFKKVLK